MRRGIITGTEFYMAIRVNRRNREIAWSAGIKPFGQRNHPSPM
jgi:hypothetical protein